MLRLPDYQGEVRNKFFTLQSILEKYKGQDSCFTPKDATSLARQLNEGAQRCETMLEKCQPKIMLYGVYNSGKSTLLNALLGEEKATVADRPETDKVTPYLWQGYELLDTPGIDAPIKHEEITKEKIYECQVVLFVVSAAGTFEDKKIYEEMRAVVDKGKRLLVVLNDKQGEGPANENIEIIKKKIHANLMKTGLSAEKSADFKPYFVNAQYALEGRLEKDEQLIEASNILQLEEAIIEEIRRVNGFSVIVSFLRYLQEKFNSYIKILTEQCSGDESEFTSSIQQLNAEYQSFCENLENRVETECAPLARMFFAQIPLDGSQKDAAAIQNILNTMYKRFHEDVWGILQDEVRTYMERLALSLSHILNEKDCSDAAVENTPGFEQEARHIASHLDTKPDFIPPAPVAEASDKCSHVEAALLPLTSMLKTPLPIPGLPPLPLGLVLGTVAKICKAVFGKSEAELANEHVMAQAAAERAAQEEHARNVELWRKELKNCYEDLQRKISREIKKDLRIYIKKSLDPIRNRSIDEKNSKKLLTMQISKDSYNFSNLMISIDQTVRELEPRATSV